jgi:hypothetical protein
MEIHGADPYFLDIPDFSSGSRLTSEPTGVAEINRNYFSGNSCTYTPLARPNATLALLEVPKRF